MEDDKVLLSRTSAGVNWIEQFEENDQADAALLLNNIRWVSHHEFTSSILGLIDFVSQSGNEKVALFVEREVDDDEVVYAFPDKNPQRAIGAAFPAIRRKANRQEIGSEGILNNIATNLARENNKVRYYFPSIDIVRENKIKKY